MLIFFSFKSSLNSPTTHIKQLHIKQLSSDYKVDFSDDKYPNYIGDFRKMAGIMNSHN